MTTEQIGESHGKRTGRRVLSTQPQFHVEVTFEDTTKLLGAEGLNIGTYTSTNKPDGTLEGEGQGVFALPDGEFVTWNAIGTGRSVDGGAVHYRGSISYTTSSTKLGRLNSVAGVFEFEVDNEGNTRTKIWDWKK